MVLHRTPRHGPRSVPCGSTLPTPVHHEALEHVQAHKIEWRARSGQYGRFAYRNGGEITDPLTAVALYQLRDAALIRVEDPAVLITPAGIQRLSEWERTLR